MIIDAHAHMVHDRYLDQLATVGGNWAEGNVGWVRSRLNRRPHYTDVTPRLEQMDRNSIDLQVVTPPFLLDSNLMPGDTEAQLAYARVLNESMAKLTEDSKGRLISVGTVPIVGFEPGGLQEMERAVNSLGLKGIGLPTNIKGMPLDLPEFDSFWARAAEMDIPVYIHPNNPAGKTDRGYEAEYDLTHNFGWPFETTLTLSRLVFSGIMERYPSLKVVGHHLGGMIPFFWGRINETYDPPEQPRLIGRVMPEPLFAYFSRFYYDTAVGGSADAIRCAYEVFGAGQLLFATDAPNGPGTGEIRLTNYPKVIKSLGLSEAENKQIFEDNARRVLNLG